MPRVATDAMVTDQALAGPGPDSRTGTHRTDPTCVDPFACRNPSLHARIGVARTDITPPADAPINNWAAARRRVASGRQSELTATVVTFTHIDSPVTSPPDIVVVALDLGWWRTSAAADKVRLAIARSLRVEPRRVLVTLSHTHAGPAIDSESVESAAKDTVEDYLQTIADAISQTAAEAVRKAQPALMEWGRGSCNLARVRDQWLDEEQRYVCGFDPAGEPDSTLLVARIVSDEPDATGNRLLAIAVNYACHPTTLGPENSEISADFVAVARKVVEDRCRVPMLFFQGASGDLAPRRQYETGMEAVQANGEQLGFAVLAAIAGMLPTGARLVSSRTVESGAPLGVWSLQADVTDDHLGLSDCRVDVPRNHLAGRWDSGKNLSEAATAERERRARLVESVSDKSHHSMPLSICRLGDVALVAVAGEAYSLLQRDLRSTFAHRAVVVLNLTGGPHHGYLPPAEAYHSDLYQVWQTPAGKGSLELVCEASVKLIRELFDSPTPGLNDGIES